MIENLFTSHLAYITIKEVGTHHTIEKFHGKKIAFESISQAKKKIKKLLGILTCQYTRTPIKFIHVNDEKS